MTTVQSTIEKNKVLVGGIWEDVINKHNPEAARQICASNYIHHDPSLPGKEFTGLDSYMKMVEAWRNAFPDIHVTVNEMVAEGSEVVTRWTFDGTHKGDLMGIPPTGRHVSATAISIHRVANHKVAEGWIIFDAMGMLQQLGVAPSA